jgi:4-amino-4-deoxy-L-arabinose transferase-like glycosyltransferase
MPKGSLQGCLFHFWPMICLTFLALIRRGIRLPPAGWMLAAMLAFYVLAGLFGRDPWKGEDAIHIGTAWHMLHYGDWLSPDLAGRPFHEPPLYYWSAALTGKMFGWLLPLHEAMRLASGVWITLALMGLYYAGRELYGEESAAASPLLLAGCAGLLFHAHDAQPMLIALAAYAGGSAPWLPSAASHA